MSYPCPAPILQPCSPTSTWRRRRRSCRGPGSGTPVPSSASGIPSIMVTDGPHGLRKQPGSGGPRGRGGERAGDLLPDGRRPRLLVRRGPGPPGGGGHRRRGLGPGRGGGARARHQHQADPAVRAQLRVPVRGPAGVGAARRGAGRRHPEPGGRRLAQALRRQQPGDRPAPGQRRGGRADPARDLPGRLRARRPLGPAVDGHVQLQPGQRGLRLGGPVAAHHGAARRVGVRRPGDVGLGCGGRPGRRRGRRPRPRDAVVPRRGPGTGGGRRRRRARSTSPWSTGRQAGCCGLLDRATPGVGTADGFDEDAHHAAGPVGRRRVRRPADQRPRTAPVGSRRGPGGGDRRVRPEPTVPGCGQLEGEPDPGGRRADAHSGRAWATGVEIDFAPGFGVDDPEADDGALRAEAVEVATGADVVLVFLGLPPSFESEGFDRDHMDLPAEQVAVARGRGRGERPRRGRPRQRRCGDHRPVAAPCRGDPRGMARRPGRRGCRRRRAGRRRQPVGPAGRDDPGAAGRHAGVPDVPGRDSEVVYGEGVFVGYRHYDLVDRRSASRSATDSPTPPSTTPTWWSTWSSDPEPATDWRGAVRITAQVPGHEHRGSVGQGGGAAVPRRTRHPGAPRTVRELRGFAKVALEPGESTTVSFALTERDLSQWSTRAHDWVLEPGRFEVSVGASSRDIRCHGGSRRSRAPVPPSRSAGTARWPSGSTTRWARGVVEDALRTAPGGDMTPLLGDPDTLRMLGSFPLTRLVVMLGDAMGDDLVDRLLRRRDGDIRLGVRRPDSPGRDGYGQPRSCSAAHDGHSRTGPPGAAYRPATGASHATHGPAGPRGPAGPGHRRPSGTAPIEGPGSRRRW